MDKYNGIHISEFRLLTETIVITVFTLALIVVGALLCYTHFSCVNKKEIHHEKRLREKALTDEVAKKKLEKLERKKKRRLKRNKSDIIADIIVYLILIGSLFVSLYFAVIPGWRDYTKKDYVVYNGEIEVYRAARHSRIMLDDGTVVWGNGAFDEDDTYGTVVYSKRFKRLVGWAEE